MGCEGGGHPQVETRTLGGADARSRGTQEEEDGTSLEGSPGLPRGLGQTALSIWTALNELAQEEEAARSLRTPHAHSNAFTLYMATQRTRTHTHVPRSLGAPWHRLAASERVLKTPATHLFTRGFHTQLDEGPETPRATREASGVPFLRQDEA